MQEGKGMQQHPNLLVRCFANDTRRSKKWQEAMRAGRCLKGGIALGPMPSPISDSGPYNATPCQCLYFHTTYGEGFYFWSSSASPLIFRLLPPWIRAQRHRGLLSSVEKGRPFFPLLFSIANAFSLPRHIHFYLLLPLQGMVAISHAFGTPCNKNSIISKWAIGYTWFPTSKKA